MENITAITLAKFKHTSLQWQTFQTKWASNYMFPRATFGPSQSNHPATETQQHSTFCYVKDVSQLLRNCREERGKYKEKHKKD